jgi:tetratricopeptide (TPR) repeat protein
MTSKRKRTLQPAPERNEAPVERPRRSLPWLVGLAALLSAGLWWFAWRAPGVEGHEPSQRIEPPDLVVPEMETPVAELLTAARKRIQADPTSAEAWSRLGALYDAHELYDGAEICYAQAHALGRADLVLVYNLGVIHDFRGRPSAAVEMLGRAAQMEPTYTPVHTRLGDVYGRMGELEKAREAYSRALELEPNHVRSLGGLGQVLIQLGDEQAAVPFLERAVQAVPTYQAALACLAQAYARLDRPEDAAQALQRSRAIGRGTTAPMEDPVRYQVIDLRTDSIRLKERATELIRAGRFEEAKTPLRTLIRAKPRTVWPRAQLGRALAATGDPRQALTCFAEARALEPRDADLCFAYGHALEQVGELDAALRQYREAVALAPDHAAAERLAELTRR